VLVCPHTSPTWPPPQLSRCARPSYVRRLAGRNML
jgi:hypothetical protein